MTIGFSATDIQNVQRIVPQKSVELGASKSYRNVRYGKAFQNGADRKGANEDVCVDLFNACILSSRG